MSKQPEQQQHGGEVMWVAGSRGGGRGAGTTPALAEAVTHESRPGVSLPGTFLGSISANYLLLLLFRQGQGSPASPVTTPSRCPPP